MLLGVEMRCYDQNNKAFLKSKSSRVYLHRSKIPQVVADGVEQVLGHRQDALLVVHQERDQSSGQQFVQVALNSAAQNAAGERVNHLEARKDQNAGTAALVPTLFGGSWWCSPVSWCRWPDAGAACPRSG